VNSVHDGGVSHNIMFKDESVTSWNVTVYYTK